jgi:hypothetical protein
VDQSNFIILDPQTKPELIEKFIPKPLNPELRVMKNLKFQILLAAHNPHISSHPKESQ